MRLTSMPPLLACGLIVLAAGCGAGGAATPSTSTTSSQSTTATSSSGSGGVSNPLNTTKIANNPCSALTPAQLVPYTGTIRKTSSPDPASCLFSPTNGDLPAASVSVNSQYAGISSLGVPDAINWKTRIPDIAGYPAEHRSGLGPTGPQQGFCGTNVLVSDHTLVLVLIQDANPSDQYYKNACAPADKLAADVVANLKSGG